LILYVETNFLLEFALEQESVGDAERLLVSAERHSITLAFPACSINEAIFEVEHRATVRRRLVRAVSDEVRILSRSAASASPVSDLSAAIQTLSEVNEAEQSRLDATLLRLLSAATCISLDADIALRARETRIRFGVEDPDALILSSILSDLERRPRDERKWFASRDRGDFSSPAIRDELRRHNCGFVHAFADAVRLVERYGG